MAKKKPAPKKRSTPPKTPKRRVATDTEFKLIESIGTLQERVAPMEKQIKALQERVDHINVRELLTHQLKLEQRIEALEKQIKNFSDGGLALTRAVDALRADIVDLGDVQQPDTPESVAAKAEARKEFVNRLGELQRTDDPDTIP